MKRQTKFLALLLVALLCICAFAACAPQTHEHTFDTAWTTDESNHWHKATCEHGDEVSDKATHTWNDGVATTPATATEEGVMTFTCTVCGKTRTETIPAANNCIVVSVEAFVLDVGYIVKPTVVPFGDDSDFLTELNKILQANGLSYSSTGEGSSFYINALNNVDLANVKVDSNLQTILTEKEVEINQSATPSENGKYVLNESTYTAKGGWMFMVNNEFPSVGIADCNIKKGDVVRMQYSVYWGSDLVNGYSAITTNNAELDAFNSLTALIVVNNYLGKSADTLNNALKAVSVWDVAQSVVDEQITTLKTFYGIAD